MNASEQPLRLVLWLFSQQEYEGVSAKHLYMCVMVLFCDCSNPRAVTVFSKNPHITWPASSTGSLSLKKLLNSLLARLTEV